MACTLSEIKKTARERRDLPGNRREIRSGRGRLVALAALASSGYTPDTSGTVFFSFGEVTLNITYLPKYTVPVCVPTAAEMQRMLLIVGSEDWAWTATCTQ